MKRQLLSIIAAALFLSTNIWAAAPISAPLADRVPDDAIYYFGWAGADAIPSMQSFGQSRLKALLDSSNVREVANEVVPRLLAKIAKQAGPEVAANIDTFKLVAGTLWKYPTAFYFTIDFNNGAFPMPHAAIFSRVGNDAASIQQRLDDLLSRYPIPPEVPIRTFVVDDLVGVSVGFDDGTMALVGVGDNKSKPISASATFTQALSRVGPIAENANAENAFVFYVDNDNLMAMADKAVLMSQNPQVVEHWAKAKEALGLADFHRAIVVSGFDGQDWSDRAFAEAPAPRKGIFSLMDRTPVPDDVLAMAPQSATHISASGMNLARAIDQIRSIAGDIDPEIQTKFNQALGVVQVFTTVNLEKDLFANLGEHWLMYDDPELSGPGLTNLIIVNHPTDPAKVQKALDALGNSFTNTMTAVLRSKHLELAVRQVKSGDITVSYLAAPVIAPSWTIHDGYLYLALYPQNAIAAAKRGKPAKSILENDAFTAMRKRLAVASSTSISFDDLPKSLPEHYQTLLLLSRAGLGMMDLAGARAPELVVPAMNELAGKLSPTGSASWVDDQGSHWRSVAPFPGAQLMSGPSTALLLAAPAIAAAASSNHVSIRATVNANDTENRIQCESHLREIGHAIVTFSNDNKGKYPPTLGALIPSVDVAPDNFLCPDHGKSAPANWNGMSAQEKSEWINNNTDFTYLGAGMSNMAPANVVVVYEEEKTARGSGMNILFGDGHVEFVNLHDAKEMIAKQGK